MSSAAIQFAAVGSFSEGLRITALPAASAIGEEPQRHHGREVEGADDADHAERLLERVDVDAGRDVLGVGALGQVPEPARELDDLHAAGDLAERVGEHLAVLGGEDLGELALAGVEQLAEREHHRLALGDRGVAPADPRSGCRVDGGGDIRCRCEPHLLLDRAERGVVDRGGAGGLACPGGPVHPVVEDRRWRTGVARSRVVVSVMVLPSLEPLLVRAACTCQRVSASTLVRASS